MKVRINEVLNYLGYQSRQADEEVKHLILSVDNELSGCIRPKSVRRRYDCAVSPVNGTVNLEGTTINSYDLSRHLAGCIQAELLAATLGPSADALVRRYSVTDIGRAAVMQAGCADMIEIYLDGIEREIALEASGFVLKPRFSPGYGDFDLSYQKDVFSLLDCSKRIGITLTAGYMMIPTKSVTAMVGLERGRLR